MSKYQAVRAARSKTAELKAKAKPKVKEKVVQHLAYGGFSGVDVGHNAGQGVSNYLGGGYNIPQVQKATAGVPYLGATSQGVGSMQHGLVQGGESIGAGNYGQQINDSLYGKSGGGGGGASGVPGLPNVGNPLAPGAAPNMFSAPTGMANPFDMANPMTQAMNQQNMPGVLGQEGNLATMLQAQANGQGPGAQLARNMMQQQTQQNIAQQAGMLASTKGLNPAIASREAAMNAGNMNQQAAMQGSQLGLQSQLGAQGQLGSLYSNMGAQQIEGRGQGLQALGQYNNLLSTGQLGAQAHNAEMAKAMLMAKYGMAGGALNAAGAVGSAWMGQAPTPTGDPNAPTDVNQQSGSVDTQTSSAGGVGGQNYGGDPSNAGSAGTMTASRGSLVPGHARTQGDSLKNDTVDAKLSPGEIVIPRSITQHPHAPWLAAAFVHEVLAGRGPKPTYKKAAGGGVQRYDEGGGVPNPFADFGGLAHAVLPDDAPVFTGMPASQYDAQRAGDSAGQIGPPAPGSSPSPAAAPSPKGGGQDPLAWIAGLPFGAGVSAAVGTGLSATRALDQNAPPPPGPTGGAKTNLNSMGLSNGQQSQGAPGSDPWAQVLKRQNDALDQMKAGAKGLGAAGAAEGKAQGAAYGAYGSGMQSAQQRYQDGIQQLNTENQQLTQAVMNGKLDPNRIWGNASTGAKVGAAIGVLLSGIGSGLTGQPNMAMGVINKLIDQDIESQKMDLGKKQTLLSMNMQKYGRLDQAYAATASQMHAALEGQLGQAAAQAGGTRAQANAQAALGQLGLQRAGLQQQNALYSAFNGAGQAPAAGGVNVDRLRLGINAGMIPKEAQQPALKEYGEYQQLGKGLQAVNKAFDTVEQNQNLMRRGGAPLQSAEQIEASRDVYAGLIAREADGKVNETAFASAQKNFPSLKDSPETIAVKRRNLNNLLKSKASFPTLQAYRLVNPNDPLLNIAGAELPGAQTPDQGE